MAEPDLYSILSVTKNASASEIKKVYLHIILMNVTRFITGIFFLNYEALKFDITAFLLFIMTYLRELYSEEVISWQHEHD